MKSGLIVRILALGCLLAAQAFGRAIPPAAFPGLASVTVSPTSISFGNQAINTKSAGQKVTVTNNQTKALTILDLSLNLPDFTETSTCPISPQTLAAGATCTVTVFFTPSVTGSRTGNLAIVNDSDVSPMVSLSGAGVLAASASPSSLTFGSQKVGTSGTAQTVTFTNNQSAALSISSIASSLADYAVTSTCPIRPSKLAAGASCTASVAFKPTATGTRSATLSFVDDANNSPQQVFLVGTGATGTLLSIAVMPTSASVALGVTQQFTATGTYSDHSTQNVTASALWNSFTASVATVNSAGLATTLSVGTTNISASSGAITGTAAFTVTAPTLASIALTPATPTLIVGMTQQLTAIGTFTDGTTKDVTGIATWNSTAKSIASVSPAGVTRGVSSGQATIKASYNSIAGSTKVTVVKSTVAYYVSPAGNDSNPGTIDLPLATPQKAESLVIANYLGTHCATQKTPIVVQFRAGRWNNLALTLTSSDNGCSSSAPVIFQNYPGETPIFSGGVRALNWVNTSGSIWQTTLPSNTLNFEALYYNGVRRQRPRLGSSTTKPLGAYYRIAANVAGKLDRFYYTPTDPINLNWKNYAPATGNPCGQAPGPANLQGDLQVAIFEQWDVSWERISCIDTTNHLIYLMGSTTSGGAHGFIGGHRYMIENIKDKLAIPGQWFLDRSVTGAWTLSYIANPGENPNVDTVIVPQKPLVLNASNVQYRTFFGITFSNDNYVVPSTGYPGSQSELLVPPAVQCLNCGHVTFDSNSFTNIAGYALAFPTDNNGTATGDIIQNNAFWDIGGGGLITGRVPTGPETDANVFQSAIVENNLMQGYGRRFPGSAAIANLLGHDVSTTHNDITDGYNQGIMICFPSFTAGCAGSANSAGAFNQVVSYNHVWNLGQGILNDFGGVYMATYNAAGDVIVNNKIHDLSDASSQDSDGYGANGLYIDRGGPIQIDSNLIYRTVNAFNVTMGPPSTGQSIEASNNILAFTRKNVVNTYACAKDGYSQFSLSGNIVLQDRTIASVPSSNIQAGASYLGNPMNSAQNFASNDYWNTAETFATDPQAFNAQSSTCQSKTYYTLAQWQSLGEDIGSLSVNPGFTSPKYPDDNYDFLSGPPNIGFIPFDTSGTCPTCPGRNNPVLTPATVPASFPTAPFKPATDY